MFNKLNGIHACEMEISGMGAKPNLKNMMWGYLNSKAMPNIEAGWDWEVVNLEFFVWNWN